MVDSGDLTHVAVGLVGLGGLGDVFGGFFGFALRFEIEAEVEVSVKPIALEGGRAGVVGLNGVEHLLFSAFAGEERVDFLQRHATVGGDLDEQFFRRLHAVDF